MDENAINQGKLTEENCGADVLCLPGNPELALAEQLLAGPEVGQEEGEAAVGGEEQGDCQD